MNFVDETADKVAAIAGAFAMQYCRMPNAVFVSPEIMKRLNDSCELKYDKAYRTGNATIMGYRLFVVPGQKEDILVGIVHSLEELKGGDENG